MLFRHANRLCEGDLVHLAAPNTFTDRVWKVQTAEPHQDGIRLVVHADEPDWTLEVQLESFDLVQVELTYPG